MNVNFKEKTLFVFCILFIVSYIRMINLTYFRFLALGIIQILAIIDIIKTKTNIKFDKKILIILLFIILSMSISNFNSKNVKESIIKIVSVLDLFIVAFILLPLYLRNIKLNRILIIVANSLGIVLTICAIIYKNDFIYTYGSGRIGSKTRLYAGFTHPNTLGMFAFICLISSIMNLMYYRTLIRKREKTYLLYNTLISSFLIFKSDCRTALICSILLILIVIFNKIFKKSKKLKMVFLILIVSIIILIIFYYINKVSYDQINKILSYRLTYIQSAFDDLKYNDNFLFGNGAFRNGNISNVEGILLDNGYINTFYQYGLVTFVFMVIFLIMLLKDILNINNIIAKQVVIELFILFLIYAIVDNILLNISSFFCLYIYIIISIIKINNKDEKYEKIDSNNSNV